MSRRESRSELIALLIHLLRINWTSEELAMHTMIPNVHRHDVSREASEVDSEGGFAASWVYGGHSLASGFT